MISEKNDRLLGSSGSSKTAEQERTSPGISRGRSSLSSGPAALPQHHRMLLRGEWAPPEPDGSGLAVEPYRWHQAMSRGSHCHRPSPLRPQCHRPAPPSRGTRIPGTSPQRAGPALPASGLGPDQTNAHILGTSLGTIEAPLFLMCAVSKKDHRRPIYQEHHRNPENLEPCTSLLLSRNQ